MSTSGNKKDIVINQDGLFHTPLGTGVIDMVRVVQELYMWGYQIDGPKHGSGIWRLGYGGLAGYVKGAKGVNLTEREAMIILIESFGRV